MKFAKAILSLLLIVTLCAACTSTQSTDYSTPDASKSVGDTESEINQAMKGISPAWAQAAEGDAKLIEGVNLDGVGNNDDAVYVSEYLWGTDLPFPRVVVVCARLGTGEVLAEALQIEAQIQDVMLADDLVTGHEAIVLELANPTSNYGAADVYVFIVEMSDHGQPYLWECLHEKVKLLIPEIELLQTGTEIVDLDGGRTGLCLKIVDGALDPPVEKTVYWNAALKNWVLYETGQTAK